MRYGHALRLALVAQVFRPARRSKPSVSQGWKPTLRHSGAGSKIRPFVITR